MQSTLTAAYGSNLTSAIRTAPSGDELCTNSGWLRQQAGARVLAAETPWDTKGRPGETGQLLLQMPFGAHKELQLQMALCGNRMAQWLGHTRLGIWRPCFTSQFHPLSLGFWLLTPFCNKNSGS